MPDGSRASMELNDADIQKIERGKPWSATITDQLTNKTYSVRGRACDFPECFCDAEVIEASEKEETV
jgi:hypothetical protein